MAVADQVPTGSGFAAKSEPDQILDGIPLSGTTAVVTGGYSGIGLETVRALAARGAKVIVPVRSPEKAQKNLEGLEGEVTALPMDLADLPSVRAFAASVSDSFSDSFDHLDLLIDNAGIMACPEARVGPGWESQFGINHMGHFALTKALMPLLEKAAAPRVVVLSSAAHKISGIRWDDLNFDDKYNKWVAYGQAKTANALFANALSRRLEAANGLAFSVHPGGIMTPLQRHLPQEEMVQLGWIDESGEMTERAKKGFKTPTQGCSTTLWAATSPKLEGKPGVYCEDCDIAAPTDPDSSAARYVGVDAHACDDEAAERLWAMSEDLLARA